MRLLGRWRLTAGSSAPHVRTVVRNFWPALMGRGVNQISAYVDGVISSLLGTGAAMAVANAQTLYTLPVSLFGMSVSAAELPAMSSVQGNASERHAALRLRLERGLHRIAFFVVPCAVAFLALGQVIAGVVFQNGRFSADDSAYVWAILAGSAVGLLASTLSRLSSSAFYALGDTRTPLKFALVRVGLTTALGFACSVYLPPLLGVPLRWGAVGLTVTAGFSAWVEFALLRQALAARIGAAAFRPWYLAKLWVASLAGAGGARLMLWFIGTPHPLVAGAVALIPFGLIYGGITVAFRVPAALALIGRSPDG
jgi:putative peptidoglycan lipid II flippase